MRGENWRFVVSGFWSLLEYLRMLIYETVLCRYYLVVLGIFGYGGAIPTYRRNSGRECGSRPRSQNINYNIEY